jgi:hypothetical protein
MLALSAYIAHNTWLPDHIHVQRVRHLRTLFIAAAF